MTPVVISIIVPIYNEELLVERLDAEIHRVMNAQEESWEVIYVNDGSEDQSLNLLRGIRDADPETVVVVDLSRNWGHQQAIAAGLSIAKGDAVVLMDGDFQDPPILIPQMIAAWRQGAEVVIGRRISRGERGVRRFLFPLFYRILGFVSDYPIPLSAGIFGLMDRKVCNALTNLQETNRFLPGLRSWVGFRTAFVDYDRPDRALGKPKQTLFHLLKYAVDMPSAIGFRALSRRCARSSCWNSVFLSHRGRREIGSELTQDQNQALDRFLSEYSDELCTSPHGSHTKRVHLRASAMIPSGHYSKP